MNIDCSDLEIVSEFQYLGDLLSCRGDVDTAVRNRIKASWANWHVLAGTMMRRDIPIKLRLSLYQSVIRSSMLYGAESWPMTQTLEQQLSRADMKMIRWIYRLNPIDRRSSTDLLQVSGLCDISQLLRQHRLRWFGHVKRSSDPLINEIMTLEADGKKGRGRPRKTWYQTIHEDLRLFNLLEDDALNRLKWKHVISQTPVRGK